MGGECREELTGADDAGSSRLALLEFGGAADRSLGNRYQGRHNYDIGEKESVEEIGGLASNERKEHGGRRSQGEIQRSG